MAMRLRFTVSTQNIPAGIGKDFPKKVEQKFVSSSTIFPFATDK
jgi:hypothetical protein